jgi:phospholipid transport system substrate-binding protein
MRRLLEAVEVVLLNDWVVAFVDAGMLCLGWTWTLASVAPTVRAAIERRSGLPTFPGQEDVAMQRQLLGIGLGLALALTLAPAGWATPPPPTEQLRTQVQRVLRVLEDPELRKASRAADRRIALRAAAAEMFELQEITKRSLGPHWNQRTPAEREEVVRLFGELLERSYLSKIETYSGERVLFTGESLDGDLALVRTRIVTKQGAEIPVDYRMLLRGDRWMVYDVVIEGVSLVANYRGQFNKIIQSGSFADLVKRLRAKLDETPGPEARLKPGASR